MKKKYILGLDLGIASVGWGLVEVNDEGDPIGLLDCGVRVFERAEVPKTGESLAKSRREARSLRRLIRRRVHRLLRLRRLLKREGLLTAQDFDADGNIVHLPINPWQLRVQGLDRKLEPKEWAAVLLHLVKHRGYLSQRKSEENEEASKSELGRLLSGVAENSRLLKEGKYRTPAELAWCYFQSKNQHIRNKGGDYSHTFNRKDLQQELHLLFEKQREWGNPYTSQTLQEQVETLLMVQKPALQGEAVLKMLGKCTFEPTEYKAAKYTYSAERFVWLTKLNNLRILNDGEERALSDDERKKLLDEPYKKAKLTYAQVRKELALPETAVFKNLRYGDVADGKKAESTALMEMKAFHHIRKALEKEGLETEWQGLAHQTELLDAIGIAFSLYKTDEDISQYLASYALPEPVLAALLKHINFDQFIELSLLALSKILPLMEQGKRYDQACTEVYGSHYGTKEQQKNQYLPVIKVDDIRNPVVFRTLTQARKVINEIIRRYGSPQRVHIETARELGKSYQDRKKIEKQQENNRKERERAIEDFKNQFPYFVGEPKGLDILKLRLYKQQQCKCLYSGTPLDINRLNEKGYVEVDHALPFSRTWDDSQSNKVLVLGSENQKKRNQTPYEYLDGANDSERWRNFKALVQGSHFAYSKKQKLQTIKLDEEGFKSKNLNDTRYIARFLCQFIEQYLHLEGQGKNVFASNGSITALLRGLWGLRKVREENDRHHALDAIVVAASTVSMQQKITKAMQKREELEYVDTQTGEVKARIPQPWDFFRQEVMIRVFSDQPKEDLEEKLSARPQAVHDAVCPLFVSRMPNRKVSGQGHLETIKSAKHLHNGISTVRKPLTSLKLKDIEKISGYQENREPALYQALRERLEAHKDDPNKAFAEPFYKPNARGELGALVRSVKLEDIQKSGVMVRNGKGIADNATMVRVDVFQKAGKNYLVPVYAWQVASGILPNKAIVAHKDESEWTEMDESFAYQFTLYPNDLVEVITKKDRIFGYYAGCNRSTAAITLKVHDLDKRIGKGGIIESIGVKNVLSFRKYQVDVLGKEIRLCKTGGQRPAVK